ncbi:MAG: DUF370 domain-containing protein [Schwartzia sp.]|nr:DUF370 domain-containing protein [Schwartzia sp. (in: firmicutes)]MBR1759583.1 DUF370 domain-containing protein [Schwartzia sp. (in: firmicutes)]MBR1884964.1 DUF370 domain-containing protein [Schwartzia sp. (in: firmicutes)]
MYLHLGGDFSVHISDVLSIHDYEKMKKTETGKKFLLNRKNATTDFSGGKPKSVVVTDRAIYLSVLSPMTLKKRAEESMIHVFPGMEA